jgi:hypothetical protein
MAEEFQLHHLDVAVHSRELYQLFITFWGEPHSIRAFTPRIGGGITRTLRT